jgi:hypothetical protein
MSEANSRPKSAQGKLTWVPVVAVVIASTGAAMWLLEPYLDGFVVWMPHAVGLVAAWAVTLRTRMTWRVKLLFGGLCSIGLVLAALTPFPTAILMGAGATLVVIDAPVWSFLRRDWVGTALSSLALVVTFLVLRGWYVELREDYRAGRIYYRLAYFPEACWQFHDKTGHARASIEDLVQAGIIEDDPAFLKTFLLGALDDRFFERDSWASVSPDFLCAYRPQGYEDASGAWLVVDMSQRVHGEAAREVVQWVSDQREAITWLDGSFPLPELERIAATDGRRGRMASVILKYRTARQLGRDTPEDVKR